MTTKLMPAPLRESVDRLRSDVLGIFERWLPERRGSRRASPADFWAPTLLSNGGPAVDVEEDDASIRVTVELPGMTKSDFHVDITGNRLTLRGEKKTDHEEKKRNYYFSERSYGSFVRSIELPSHTVADKASAEFKNGVLHITVPKSDDAKAKRITIATS